MKQDALEIKPIGHSLADYQQMFDLTAADLKKHLLDCLPGPNSFNFEVTAKNGSVISVDPLFSLNYDHMADLAVDYVLAVNSKKTKTLIWQTEEEINNFAKSRCKNMIKFLADYDQGLQEKRYLPASLPNLPFADHSFDLALCSHALFIQDKSPSALVADISEACRVATELRIFPLLDAAGAVSANLGPVILMLQSLKFGVEVRQVPYCIQPHGNAMLRVWAQTCEIT